MLSLIFFACLSTGCREPAEKEIRLIWKEDRAISLHVPGNMLKPHADDSLAQLLQVKLEGAANTPIMGNIEEAGNLVKFTPLIPFTRGHAYHIYFRNKPIGKVEVPVAVNVESPAILAIYPSNDTLPENLLKLYFQFSKPMRTGQSLNYLYLLNENNDTLKDIFLELQPELWNTENTVLTIWLDPGRIKRDLVPNKKLGNPLITGKKYRLVVNEKWKDVQDLALRNEMAKTFHVTGRDERSPEPLNWKLTVPATGSREALKISFSESLDYFLLQETVKVIDMNGKTMTGEIQILPEEKGVLFFPQNSWQPGKYTISVAPHLEDIAGNNLEKLFDRDLEEKANPSIRTIYFTLIN